MGKEKLLYTAGEVNWCDYYANRYGDSLKNKIRTAIFSDYMTQTYIQRTLSQYNT